MRAKKPEQRLAVSDKGERGDVVRFTNWPIGETRASESEDTGPISA